MNSVATLAMSLRTLPLLMIMISIDDVAPGLRVTIGIFCTLQAALMNGLSVSLCLTPLAVTVENIGRGRGLTLIYPHTDSWVFGWATFMFDLA